MLSLPKLRVPRFHALGALSFPHTFQATHLSVISSLGAAPAPSAVAAEEEADSRRPSTSMPTGKAVTGSSTNLRRQQRAHATAHARLTPAPSSCQEEPQVKLPARLTGCVGVRGRAGVRSEGGA